MRKAAALAGYINLGWTQDLKPWGLTVSYWFDPKTWDPETKKASVAYYYKHTSGKVHVAKTYEEQVAIHERYGIPIVEPGARFSQRDKLGQLRLFDREEAPVS